MAFTTHPRKSVPAFFAESGARTLVTAALNECYAAQAPPGPFFADHFQSHHAPPHIDAVELSSVLDGFGGRCLMLTLKLHAGVKTAVPVWGGTDVSNAGTLQSIADRLTSELSGQRPDSALDGLLQRVDGTERCAALGHAVMAALSVAVHRCAADLARRPVFEQLSRPSRTKYHMPLPVVSLFGSSSKHFGRVRILEVALVPPPDATVADGVDRISKVVEVAIPKLSEDETAPSVIPSGALRCMQYDSLVAAVDLAEECIRDAGLQPGTDLNIAVIFAGALCFRPDPPRYAFTDATGEMTGAQLAEHVANVVKEKPSVVYIEDVHEAEDTVERCRLMARLGDSVAVASSFSSTAAATVARDSCAANTAVVRIDQCGTVGHALAVAESFAEKGFCSAVAAAPPEGSPDFIADFAVAAGAQYCRVGGLLRECGAASVNRLLAIEAQLSNDALSAPRPVPDRASLVLPPAPEPVAEVIAKSDKKRK